MNNKKLNETASGGAIGSGGIAVRLDGKIIDGKERRRLQDFLRSFNKKVTNRFKYKPVTPFPITVNEAFDIQDVLSRLRGLEDRPNARQEGVTYGVEDNEGNVMKVTVRKDQAGEFETTLGHELADIEAFSITGQSGKDISMAELLFNLKDRFDIIDVQFPKIPTDVVYNADDASFNVPDSQLSNDEVPDDDFDDMDAGMGPDDMMNLDDMDEIEGEEGEAGLDGDMGGDGELEGELDDIDADGVEDFTEPAEPEGSILDKVLDMLKSQADAERAKAEAAAEESRAKQAEYSARASEATIAQEEELARMEADMEQQKDKEKQARKLADIAKYRVSKASGLRESDDLETVAMVRRMMTQVQQQFSFVPNPNASEQENAERRQYMAQQKANKMRELQARMRSARAREIYDAQQQRNQKQQQVQQRQQDQRGQDGQQQQQSGNQQGGIQGNENI